jgi:hypothetical protein
MKAQAPLRHLSFHDPIENEVKGFAEGCVGKNFFDGRAIQTGAWIIETGVRRQVSWPDHDDLACCRAF